MEALTQEAFETLVPVSRETGDRLNSYADLLSKWNARINLVSKSTLPDLWRRHMLDSAQLAAHIPPNARTLADIGSGAGFPGLVLAAITALDIHLVESDARKCAFLREAARVMGVGVTIHRTRIEKAALRDIDVVTARALASLDALLGYAAPMVKNNGICLFLKGTSLDTELTAANKIWHIESTKTQSLSDPSSWILRVEAFRRADKREYRDRP